MTAMGDAGDPAQTVWRLHGSEPRGLLDVPHSSIREGFFGRMFRTLPPFEPDDAALIKLARFMFEPKEQNEEDDEGNNPSIPAGYTYLGQFIDHDITFDPTSKLQRVNDPDALRNFRTPRLDLDSLYGSGPSDEPFLYDADGLKLRTGQTAACEPDLPRVDLTDAEKADPTRNGRRALIGDPRNDENVITSQLHLGFISYHNAVVDALKAGGTSSAHLFDKAQRIVRWHYQWLIVNDFLPRIVGQEVVDDLLRWEEYDLGTSWNTRGARIGQRATGWVAAPKLRFFTWHNQPFVPVEFAAAAFRFGHSMVRGDYTLNDRTRGKNEIVLFVDPKDRCEDQEEDLRGFRERPRLLTIDWTHFFAFPDVPWEEDRPQPSRKIDTNLTFRFSLLPASLIGRTDPVLSRSVESLLGGGRFHDSLVGMLLSARNLLRGKAVGLPTGQDVARAMGLPDELILDRDDFANLAAEGLQETFGDTTPLWYYILKEAEVVHGGARLGPVGGRIVAEVLIGLLYGDRLSYLRGDPLWQPAPGQFGARGGRSGEPIFGMPELFGFPTQPPSDSTRDQGTSAGPRDHRRAPSWARRDALRKESNVAEEVYDALEMKIPVDRNKLKDLIDPLTKVEQDMPSVFLTRFIVNNERPVRMFDRVGSFLFYVERVPANGGCVKLRLGANPESRDNRAATIYFKHKIPPADIKRDDTVYDLIEGDAVLLINEKFELSCPDFVGARVLMAGLAPNQTCGTSPCP
jgi:hypothetical protein